MKRPTLLTTAALALAAGLALAAPTLAQDSGKSARAAAMASGPEIPIERITLYRSGVGFFQRGGMVDAGDRVQLRFATDQINDMLKSMVILDPQQALESVGYGSKEPLARRLASFGIDLSDQPSLATILTRLRGTKVKFVTPDGPVEGVILGGEVREQAQGESQKPIAVPYINVVTKSGIKSVALTSIASVEIADEALNDELMKALSALGEHSVDRMKTVDLTFAGQGARQVLVAYVNEMPVWKTSYRLVLDESGEPTIQGWAIVENTTDEDWEDVQLGLVAGRPVSFRMDLYEPLHVARPEIPVPTVPGVAPRAYQDAGGFDEMKRLVDQARPEAPAPAAAAKRIRGGETLSFDGRAAESGTAQFGFSAESMTKYAAVAQAQGSEVGEVFEYTLSTPISIARQRSAMLPILSSGIEGRRVSIFNRGDGVEHPMRGVEIKNTTGLQLIPGPISVFDGPAYAGDAQIGHITTGDKRLLAYAVDLDVAAAAKDEQKSTVRQIKIVNGMIEFTVKQEYRTGYAFKNKDAKRARTVLVEQAKMPGWDLVAPAKAAEETKDLYRFEVEIAAGKEGKVDVQLERTERSLHEVSSYPMPTLLGYMKDGKASQAVVDAVRKAADLQAAINATQQKINELDAERQAIGEDQTRVRQNMATVGKETDIYRRWLAKFSEQETRLEAMATERKQLVGTLEKQQRELEAYIRALNVQ
jgi:hypothetical protein